MAERVKPDSVDLIVQDNPFQPARTAKPIYAGYGATVEQIVIQSGLPPALYSHCEVTVGDTPVDRLKWHEVTPELGTTVYIRIIVRGGDGGGKDILRAVAMIAVAVVAFAVAGPLVAAMGLTGTAATIATAVIQTAVMTAGMFLVNALIPPPTPKSQYGWDQDAGNPYGQITGLRNQMAPYADVPRVQGRRRMFPMLAGRPYTETVGNDQYLVLLLLVGQGPLRISEIKLGDTPISYFPGTQIETREGWPEDAPVTLYRKSIREDLLNVILENAGNEGIRTTRTDTTEISVELSFPSGVNRVKDGELRYHEASFSVQYRETGTTGAWLNANWIDKNSAYGTQTNGVIFVRDKTQTGLRKAGRWSVPKGQYDVKVRRTTARGVPGEVSYCAWTALRSIVDENFLPEPGYSLIAMRLKASGQLNGVPDQINCLAESYLPVYDPVDDEWTYQVTRNPAWAYADLLRRRGWSQMIPDHRIDLDAIVEWAADCDAAPPNGDGPYYTFDTVFEGGSIFTGLRTAAAHGRASFTMRNGKYSVVRDKAQSVPVQHISPRNSWAYNGSKSFTDIPHALRVRFSNEEKLYAEDEVVVYRPGYAEKDGPGVLKADKFETIDMPGCSRAEQAWREGMYHFAVMELRPETHIVTMDVENVRCTLGSYVRFSHDVIKVGLGHGRIAERIVTGGNVTGFVLDSPVSMATGKTYGLRARRADFSSAVMTLAAYNGETATVTLATPIPLANAPDAGDLFQFGESGLETAPMVVKKIVPGEDFQATLHLVDAQPGVWTADQGVIPPFQTYITNPVPIEYVGPPVPVMRLTSDSNTARYTADSTIIERIAVAFEAWPSGEGLFDEVEIRYRDTESPEFTLLPRLSRETSGTFIEPVQAGANYVVQARTITLNGTSSEWATGTIQAAGKTIPPLPPVSLEATNGIGSQVGGITLKWGLSTDVDLWGTEIFCSATNDRSTATLVDAVADPGTTYTHALAGEVTRYYWVRSVDLSGNRSTDNPDAADQWFPVSATAGVMGQTREITAGEIDTTPPGVPVGLAASSATIADPATGQPITSNTATWTANTETDLAGYILEIKRGAAGTPELVNVPGNRYTHRADSGVTYYYRVVAYDRVNNRSGYSGQVSVVAGKDITPPALPTSVTATAYFQTIGLTWTNPADSDLAFIEVWANTTNTFAGATKLATVPAEPSGLGTYLHSGLPSGATRYYWLKAGDNSDNVTTTQTASVNATVATLPIDQLDNTPPPVPAAPTVTSSLTVDNTGQQIVKLRAVWTAVTAADLSGYEVWVSDGGAVPAVQPVYSDQLNAEFVVLANQAYTVKVRSFDKLGNRSAWSSITSHTTTRDTTAPGVPTGLTATAFVQSIGLSWTNVTAADLAFVEIHESPTNGSGGAVLIDTVAASSGAKGTYLRADAGSAQRWYYLKSVDKSGNKSGFSALATATPQKVGPSELAPGLAAIEYGNYGAPASAGANAPSLPTTGNYVGRQAFNTNAADQKLYRYTAGGWSKAVAAVEITGTLTNAQIGSVDATKITGALTDAQIADIAAAKLTGQIVGTQISDLAISTPKLAAGAITAEKIAASTITGDRIAAGAITTPLLAAGAVNADKLAANSVVAGKIAAGAATFETLAVQYAGGANLIPNIAFTGEGYALNTNLTVPPTGWSRLVVNGQSFQVFDNIVDAPAKRGIRMSRGASGTAELSVCASTIGFNDTNAASSHPIEINPGDEFLVEYWGWQSSLELITSDIVCLTTAGAVSNTGLALTAIEGCATSGNGARCTVPVSTWGRVKFVVRYTGTDTRKVWLRFNHGTVLTSTSMICLPRFSRRAESNLIVDGSITTTKLQVGDYSNLVNDNFSDLSAWSNTTAAVAYEKGNPLDNGKTTFRWLTNQTGLAAYAFVGSTESRDFSVKQGAVYNASAIVRVPASAAGRFQLGILWHDATGAQVGAPTIGSVDSNGTDQTVTLSANVVPPDTAVTGRLRTRVAANASGVHTSGAYYRDLTVRRAASGELIVDGAITAVKIAAATITGDRLVAGTISTGLIAAGAVNADKLASNAVTAVKVAAGAITTDKLDAGAVTAVKIAAGTITGDRISAGTITATRLALTNPASVIPDSTFRDPAFWGSIFYTGSMANIATVPTDAYWQYGQRAVHVDAIGNLDCLSDWIPVQAGNAYLVEFRFWGNASGTTQPGWIAPFIEVPNWAWINFKKSATAGIQTAGSPSWTPPADQKWDLNGDTGHQSFVLNIPAGLGNDKIRLRYIGAHPVGSSPVMFNMIIRPMAGASLIVDGAITAAKVQAGSITGDRLVAGTITANLLAADSITASKLMIGTGNLNPDPHFQDPAFWGWDGNYANWYPQAVASSAYGINGGQMALWEGYPPPGTGIINRYGKTFRLGVKAGQKVRLRAKVHNGSNRQIVVKFLLLDEAGAYAGECASHVNAYGGTQEIQSGEITVPANATKCCFELHAAAGPVFAGVAIVGQISVNEMTSGVLIQDGAITAVKIQANSVTADRLNVATLSSITANIGTVTAGRLQNAANTTWFDLTNSRQQFQVGSYALRQGSIGSTVLMWYGETSVAVGSETRTNGIWAFGTDGKVYYGTAELPAGGGGGGGGAAFTRQTINATITGTSWQTIASITFSAKPSSGWWDANMFGLTGYADGYTDTGVEFRIIESGASAALSTSSAIYIPAGMPGVMDEPWFAPSAPWQQTRPAGNLTLLLQARQIASYGVFTNLTGGTFSVSYTPGA